MSVGILYYAVVRVGSVSGIDTDEKEVVSTSRSFGFPYGNDFRRGIGNGPSSIKKYVITLFHPRKGGCECQSQI